MPSSSLYKIYNMRLSRICSEDNVHNKYLIHFQSRTRVRLESGFDLDLDSGSRSRSRLKTHNRVDLYINIHATPSVLIPKAEPPLLRTTTVNMRELSSSALAVFSISRTQNSHRSEIALSYTLKQEITWPTALLSVLIYLPL